MLIARFYTLRLLVLLPLLTQCTYPARPKAQLPPPADARSAVIGGGCEGCELMEVGQPDTIGSLHTSPGWTVGGQRLLITGTVFQNDGRTPAPDIVVYYWHTDKDGLYTADQHTPAAARQHGRMRGWVKTGPDGRYTIRTSRPAAYPDEDIPQHIHLSVQEPALANPYYLDWYFDDDPLYLAHRKRYGQADRGGTEILRVLLQGAVQVVEHDIILGLNIPHYPAPAPPGMSSGLPIGTDQPSFMPYHAYGPDKGSRTCPVCKYGRYHGLLYFVGNRPNWQHIADWLRFLEAESLRREQYLKVYFVYGNGNNFQPHTRQQELESLGHQLGLKKTALTYVPSFSDTSTEAHLNQINAEAESTILFYKHRIIADKWVNLPPTPENFRLLSDRLDQTRGDFFDLPAPRHD